MKQPKISIIILNWNGWKDTIECLESLYRIDYPDYEVIIVDNNSKDDSIKKIKNWAKGKIKIKSKFFKYDSKNKPIKYLEVTKSEIDKGIFLLKKRKMNKLKSNKKLFILKNDKNAGFSGGNNIAMKQILKEGKSKYIFLLANDAVFDKSIVVELVKLAEVKKKVGVLGSKIYNYFGKQKNILQSAGAKVNLLTANIYSRGEGEQDKKQFEEIKEVDFLCGSSLFLKSEVIRKIGLLEENFFLYFEDVDYCLTAKKAGYHVLYVPRSKMWHKGSAIIGTIPGYGEYYAIRSRFWFERKYANIFQLIFFLFYFFTFKFYLKLARCFSKKNRIKLLKSFLRGLKDGMLINKVTRNKHKNHTLI